MTFNRLNERSKVRKLTQSFNAEIHDILRPDRTRHVSLAVETSALAKASWIIDSVSGDSSSCSHASVLSLSAPSNFGLATLLDDEFRDFLLESISEATVTFEDLRLDLAMALGTDETEETLLFISFDFGLIHE